MDLDKHSQAKLQEDEYRGRAVRVYIRFFELD